MLISQAGGFNRDMMDTGMSSLVYDSLNMSYQQNKAEKSKQRWQKVMENKDKLTLDHQVYIKKKLDKEIKTDKVKSKRREMY